MVSRPYLTTNLIDPAEKALIEFGITPQGITHPLSLFEKTRQNLIHVRDRKRIIRPIVIHRSLGPRSASRPNFFSLIAVAAEQNELTLLPSGDEYRHCLGFWESRKI
jgi:hypothetical protein